MNDVFCNELEGKLVAIEFVNGDYKKGRIMAFHPEGDICAERFKRIPRFNTHYVNKCDPFRQKIILRFHLIFCFVSCFFPIYLKLIIH